MLGAVVGGRYRVQAKLGNGAMGSVYRCTDARGGPEVAAKVLAPGLADALKAEARFRQEIKAATLLAHPNIVETHDFGHTDDGRPFYIMELVEGASLASVIKSSAPIELSRALRVARDVAAGLEHAHAKGIVHRDIKPDNIMIGDVSGSESAKILDFGILKILQAAS
jgi:serine/threonine protein kinase